MRLNVNPNRMELLKLKKRIVLAHRGHKLLKDKQDELMRYFLSQLTEVKKMRKEVNIFIFLLGLLTFNWPLMKIFDFSLPIYMFLLWFLFITVIMIYSFSKKTD